MITIEVDIDEKSYKYLEMMSKASGKTISELAVKFLEKYISKNLNPIPEKITIPLKDSLNLKDRILME